MMTIIVMMDNDNDDNDELVIIWGRWGTLKWDVLMTIMMMMMVMMMIVVMMMINNDDNVFSGEASDKAKRPNVQATVVS